MKVGRNDPCHCGSGQKYKKCCLAKDDAARSAELAAQAAKAAEAAAAAEAEAEGGKGEKGDDRAPGTRAKGGAAPPVQPKTSAPGPAPAFRRKAV